MDIYAFSYFHEDVQFLLYKLPIEMMNKNGKICKENILSNDNILLSSGEEMYYFWILHLIAIVLLTN